MSKESVEERVREVVVNDMGVDEEQVTREARFVEDLDATDPLDMVGLVMGFEDEFSIEIPDEEAEKFKTVGDVVDYIEGIPL